MGTGKGYSVLDVVHAFEKACGKKIPYAVKPRRPGDIATCYADPAKAKAAASASEACCPAQSPEALSMHDDRHRAFLQIPDTAYCQIVQSAPEYARRRLRYTRRNRRA